MKCPEIRTELAGYLGRETNKKADIEQHVKYCSSCARELVRIELTEKELRNGLSDTHDTVVTNLGAWLQQQARKLSEEDVRERKAWVQAVAGEGTTNYPPANAKREKRIWQAVAAVVLFFLLANWPPVVRAASQLPVVGEWIQYLVIRDAGLEWAYQNGYISNPRISVESGSVSFAILGVVADPVQTTVFYLVDGFRGASPWVSIAAVNDRGVASWSAPGVNTPLGVMGMAHSYALGEGDHELTLVLNKSGNLTSELELRVPVSREAISRLSQSYNLVFSKTVDGVTLSANQMVLTPTQIRVDYTVNGGGLITGGIRKEHTITLLSENGEKTDSAQGGGTQIDGEWQLYQVFNRPSSLFGLKMFVPALSRYEEINMELTREDVGNSKEDYGVSLQDWRVNGSTIEIDVRFTNEKIQGLGKWSILGQDGKIYAAENPGYSFRTAGDGPVGATYYLPLEDGVTPVKVVAGEVQLIVEGNWEVTLPSIQ